MDRAEAPPRASGGAVLGGLLFSTAGLAVALAQLALDFPAFALPPRWLGQASFLMAAWMILSLAPALLRAGAFARVVYACLRFVLYELLAYPFGGLGGIPLALLCALTAEAALALEPPADRILPVAFIALSLVRPPEATAWDRAVQGFDPARSAILAFIPLALTVALWSFKSALAKASDQAALIGRLKRSGLDLIDTNIVLQEKIVHQEARLLEMERSRISRELHDTIGYTLMNILAMQKAATAILGRDPKKAREFIQKTMEQSELGLRETRAAIGSLRGMARREASIAEVVTRLAKAFENTHIRITADLNNSSPSYGSGVDEALGRFVQEAITNAIKHGNADEIFIGFWRSPEGVTVAVRDNGSGIPATAKSSEGLGLRGMRERLGELGGSVELGNAFGGFRITAFVPASACQVEM